MYEIAEVGEFVFYNGKQDPKDDPFQNELIEDFLEIGKSYEVSKVLICHGGYKGNDFYKFRYAGRNYWFPACCFDYDIRANITKKYGLR